MGWNTLREIFIVANSVITKLIEVISGAKADNKNKLGRMPSTDSMVVMAAVVKIQNQNRAGVARNT